MDVDESSASWPFHNNDKVGLTRKYGISTVAPIEPGDKLLSIDNIQTKYLAQSKVCSSLPKSYFPQSYHCSPLQPPLLCTAP